MGNIASELSDYVIFTNDNPRTEDPEKIMSDILVGVSKTNYEVILDRSSAIKKAMELLKENDILLILGKGHENYQIIGHTKHHLDDSEEVINFISKNRNEIK
jgi:UDP-N-acetylmuramoyl-L-alanyl-D-glutamate--2,6-diaminopimelate ligase